MDLKADIVLDRTLNNYDKAAVEIARLKAAGYEVHLAAVSLDTAEALRRADKRAGTSGRYVPEPNIVGTRLNLTTRAQSILTRDG